MPSLSELQHAVAERILGSPSPAVEDWIRLPPGVDCATRLAIYTDGYPARLAESLAESYPAVANILGAGSFAALASRYGEHPRSEVRNLNYVGVDLPSFLQSDSASEELPFLPDLARLEWAVLECFHARSEEPFDAAACRGRGRDWAMDDWALARVEFQPGVAVLRSPWPIRELRDTRDQEREDIDVDLVERPDCVLVYRQGFDVISEALEAPDACALERLKQGAPLGVVTAELAQAGAQGERVAQLFARWSSLGLVTSAARAE
jgi:hypothetical protein